jgi:hypothetical protein
MERNDLNGPVIVADDQAVETTDKPTTAQTVPPPQPARKPIYDPLAALVFEIGYRAIQRHAFIAPGIAVRLGKGGRP